MAYNYQTPYLPNLNTSRNSWASGSYGFKPIPTLFLPIGQPAGILAEGPSLFTGGFFDEFPTDGTFLAHCFDNDIDTWFESKQFSSAYPNNSLIFVFLDPQTLIKDPTWNGLVTRDLLDGHERFVGKVRISFPTKQTAIGNVSCETTNYFDINNYANTVWSQVGLSHTTFVNQTQEHTFGSQYPGIQSQLTVPSKDYPLVNYQRDAYQAVRFKWKGNDGTYISGGSSGEGARISGINFWETQKIPEREYVEFNDAITTTHGWKAPRYDGVKLKGLQVNKYTPPTKNTRLGDPDHYEGDKTYGTNPVIEEHSSALYISNTVIDAYDENPQFAKIKDHSYIDIKSILLINTDDDTVQTLNANTEKFDVFHRFITNDFPTGAPFQMKVIDPAIANKLKNQYHCKMNKGFLLKSFRYNPDDFVLPGMELDGVTELPPPPPYTEGLWIANPLGLYNAHSGSVTSPPNPTGTVPPELSFGSLLKNQNADGANWVNAIYGPNEGGELRFRWGTSYFTISTFVPFAIPIQPFYSGDNTTFIKNKFTSQFVKKSNDPSQLPNTFSLPKVNNLMKQMQAAYPGSTFVDLVSGDSAPPWDFNPTWRANVFIGSCIKWLTTSGSATELHLTLHDGTKDYSGRNDEMSISTFEVDRNADDEYLNFNPIVNTTLSSPGPVMKFMKLKNQPQFKPTVPHNDNTSPTTKDIINRSVVALGNNNNYLAMSEEYGSFFDYGPGSPSTNLDVDVYGQDAAGNPFPYENTPENSKNFSGSYTYQLSFLDKSHTLISDVAKNEELFDGIGQEGVVIIPNYVKPEIRDNIDYYLQKAGISTKGTPTKAPARGK